MITIIHGDNTVLSRKQLISEIDKRSAAGKTVRSFTASELNIAGLTQALHPTSLFGDEQVLVIERLFRLRSTTLRDQMLTALISQHDIEVLLWEDKLISATNLKLLETAKPQTVVFKISPIVFQVMDQFGDPAKKVQLLKQLHAAYDQDSAEFVFAMLTRQIRLLINVVEGETAAMKPYTLQKMRTQARFFPLEKALRVHRQLLEIDLAQKTSGSLLSLEQQLDLLALECAT